MQLQLQKAHVLNLQTMLVLNPPTNGDSFVCLCPSSARTERGRGGTLHACSVVPGGNIFFLIRVNWAVLVVGVGNYPIIVKIRITDNLNYLSG